MRLIVITPIEGGWLVGFGREEWVVGGGEEGEKFWKTEKALLEGRMWVWGNGSNGSGSRRRSSS